MNEIGSMNWQFTSMAWLYLLAAVVGFGLAWRGWTLRSVRGAWFFVGMTFSAAIWTLGYLFGFFHKELAVKIVMLRVEYFGAILTIFFWLLFAAAYSGSERWLTGKALVLLSFIPIFTFLQVLTIEHQNFFYRSFELAVDKGLVVSAKHYGPGFFVWIVFAYSMVLAGGMILMRGLIYLPALQRRQVIPLTTATVVALLPNLLNIVGLNPIAPYDPTCLSFSVVGVLVMLSMGRYRLLDLAPVAHYLVFEHARVGVVVVDENDRILKINPAAEALIGHREDAGLGRDLSEVLPLEKRTLDDGSEHREELELAGERVVEVQSTPILTRQGVEDGRIVMLYDITERVRAERELRRQATTDPLTEVLNRRQFFLLGEQCRRQARRKKAKVTGAMIDLDHFKAINDRYGHAMGDEFLREVALRLQEGLREGDILARYGGEEFVLLMPDTDLDHGLEVLERLRQKMQATPLNASAGELEITISAGVAELDPEEERALDRLIDRADRALYAAKKAGRNRVLVS